MQFLFLFVPNAIGDLFLFVLIASLRPFSHQVEGCTHLCSSMKCIIVLQFCNLAGTNCHSTFFFIVTGPNDHTIAQIKDVVRDGLRAVKNTIEDEAVVLVSSARRNV